MDFLYFVNANKINTDTIGHFRKIIEKSGQIIGEQIRRNKTWTTGSGLFGPAEFSPERPTEPPLSIVLGGDGTILSAANYLHTQNLPIGPIMGVNFGKLGYLAHFNSEDFEQQLPMVIEANPWSNRIVLNCEVNNQEHLAFNDFVIDIGPPFRMVEIEILIDGSVFSTIRGDGVIVSTPTGSTAYNLSAGGPIVEPDVEGIIISPLAPHKISIRPMVVNCNRTISLNLDNPEGAYAILDGQRQFKIEGKQEIVIQKHREPLVLVEPRHGFMQSLTNKLNWGK